MIDEKKRLLNLLKKEESSMAVFLRDGHFTYEVELEGQSFQYHPEKKCLSVPLEKILELDLSNEEFLGKFYMQLGMIRILEEEANALKNRLKTWESLSKMMVTYMGKELFPGREKGKEELFFSYARKEISRLYYVFDLLASLFLLEEVFPYFRSEEFSLALLTLWEKEGLLGKKGQSHLNYIYCILSRIRGGEGIFLIPPNIAFLYERKRLGRDLPEFLRLLFGPKGGTVPPMDKRDRYIEGFFLNVYLGLWQEDLEKFAKSAQKEYEKNSEGSLPQEVMVHKMEEEVQETSLEFMDPLALEELLNQMQGNPDSMEISTDTRRRIIQEMEMETLEKNYSLRKAERDDYEEVLEDVAPLRKDMRPVWKAVLGESILLRQRVREGQPKGRLDVEELIRIYPDFVEMERTGKKTIPIYQKFYPQPVTTIAPDRIEVTLLMDNSGSMDPIKIFYAKRAMMAMLQSLKDFGEYLHRYRKELKKLCRLYTQVIYFGTEYKEVLPMKPIIGSWERQGEWAVALRSLDGSFGYTRDDLVLEDLRHRISPVDRKSLTTEKLLKIFFIITDGASNEPEKTRKELEKLNRMGVHVFGFQMGELSESELERFQEIWNDQREEPRGIVLEDRIKDLPEALLQRFTGIVRGSIKKSGNGP